MIIYVQFFFNHLVFFLFLRKVYAFMVEAILDLWSAQKQHNPLRSFIQYIDLKLLSCLKTTDICGLVSQFTFLALVAMLNFGSSPKFRIFTQGRLLSFSQNSFGEKDVHIWGWLVQSDNTPFDLMTKQDQH